MRVYIYIYIYICVCVCVCDGVYAYRRCIGAAVARNEIIHRRALVIECFAAREKERGTVPVGFPRVTSFFLFLSLFFAWIRAVGLAMCRDDGSARS